MTHRVVPAGTDDFFSLLELWNACAQDRFPLTERALRNLLEGSARTTSVASLVVREGDRRPAGWVLARAHSGSVPALERFRCRGGIAALCVRPDRRRQGIGRALLEAAEAHLAGHGVLIAETLVEPFHLMPGVPEDFPAVLAFLAAQGFQETSRCMDLEGDMSAYEVPVAVLEKLRTATPGVQIRPLREIERSGFVRFVRAEFPGTWQFLAEEHAAGGRLEDVVVAVEDGAVIGFCMVHDPGTPALAGSTTWFPALGPAYGGLGPIGMGAAQRGRGLGLALLCLALDHQRRRGVRRMVIDWTTLEDFYARAGFRPWRRYVQMTKPLA